MTPRTLALLAVTAGLALPAAAAATPRLTLTPIDRAPAEAAGARPDAAALAALAAAVEAAPKDRRARFAQVRALMRAAELDAALVAARAWRAIDAYDLVVVRLIGDILREKGDRAAALRAYSAVVELLPEDPAAQRALASVLKQGGELEAAYQRLDAAAALRPDDRRLAFELADVAHRLGRDAEARERFERLSGDDQTPDAIRYPARQRLGQLYAAARRAALAAGDQAAARALDRSIAGLELAGGTENDIKIYLTWDTDRSDVDLWVTAPGGEKIYYQHRKGQGGEALFDDVTTGYGPESFTAPAARRGRYLVQVNYFSAGRGNFSEARGEVVVVLDEGRASEQRFVLPYRLFDKGQTVTVASIDVK
jgi:tetratricopeptide (TPR) repeat protein